MHVKTNLTISQVTVTPTQCINIYTHQGVPSPDLSRGLAELGLHAAVLVVATNDVQVTSTKKEGASDTELYIIYVLGAASVIFIAAAIAVGIAERVQRETRVAAVTPKTDDVKETRGQMKMVPRRVRLNL